MNIFSCYYCCWSVFFVCFFDENGFCSASLGGVLADVGSGFMSPDNKEIYIEDTPMESTDLIADNEVVPKTLSDHAVVHSPSITTVKAPAPSPEAIVKDEGLLLLNMEPAMDNLTTMLPSTVSSAVEGQSTISTKNDSSDVGIVTSLGLDKDAAISPVPPIVQPGPFRDNFNNLTGILTKQPFTETKNDTTDDEVPSTPREPATSTTIPATTTTTKRVDAGVVTSLGSAIVFHLEPDVVLTTTTEPTKTTVTTTTAQTTTFTTTQTSTTLRTVMKTTEPIKPSTIGTIFLAAPTTTTTPASKTTTGFLSFLDPEFEKKYVPRRTTTPPPPETSRQTQPLSCYICSNSSTNCDISLPVDPRQHGPSIGGHDYETLPAGITLVQCPPSTRSCGKQTVTVRYLFDSDIKYETTVNRFCSNVYQDSCDSKSGSSSSYEQCYCRSHGCNSANRLLLSSSLQSHSFIIIVVVAITTLITNVFSTSSLVLRR